MNCKASGVLATSDSANAQSGENAKSDESVNKGETTESVEC